MKKILGIIVLISSQFVHSQNQISQELTGLNLYNVITTMQETNLKVRTSFSLTAYCKNVKSTPKEPIDLLTFSITSGYHPNEMIIDDFPLDLLRISQDYEGFLTIYFIGPDFIDDKLKTVILYERMESLSFEEYKNLKGDFILGLIDVEDAKFYSGKN